MSTLGSRIASGSRSGVVSSSTSRSRPPSRKRASRRKRGSRLATRTRARGSSSSSSNVHGAAVGARVGGAPRRPGDAVADLEPAPPALARRQLDDLARAAARHRAPRADLVLDPDHDLIGVEEDGVDREAHERGVDAPARAAAPCPRPAAGTSGRGARASGGARGRRRRRARRRSDRPPGGASASPWVPPSRARRRC